MTYSVEQQYDLDMQTNKNSAIPPPESSELASSRRTTHCKLCVKIQEPRWNLCYFSGALLKKWGFLGVCLLCLCMGVFKFQGGKCASFAGFEKHCGRVLK